MIALFASGPTPSIAHGAHGMPSTGSEPRKPSVHPTFNTEKTALEEISFLLRDLEKRMRIGDVEGVHDGAREIAATVDNLWKAGFKKLDDRRRMTLNGYMNLFKSESVELDAYQGKEDLDAGREKLARLKEIFSSIRKQFEPDSRQDSLFAPGPVAPAAPTDRVPTDSGNPASGKVPAELKSKIGGY